MNNGHRSECEYISTGVNLITVGILYVSMNKSRFIYIYIYIYKGRLFIILSCYFLLAICRINHDVNFYEQLRQIYN